MAAAASGSGAAASLPGPAEHPGGEGVAPFEGFGPRGCGDEALFEEVFQHPLDGVPVPAPVVPLPVLHVAEPGCQFGGGQRLPDGQGFQDLGRHPVAQFGVHRVRAHPFAALPLHEIVEMVRADEAGLVGPVLHHPARVGPRHPRQDGAVVVAEPGEERQEVAAGHHIDGVDLNQVQPGKGTAHRPCTHGSGGPFLVQSLGCQRDPPCLCQAQRCLHVSPFVGKVCTSLCAGGLIL